MKTFHDCELNTQVPTTMKIMYIKGCEKQCFFFIFFLTKTCCQSQQFPYFLRTRNQISWSKTHLNYSIQQIICIMSFLTRWYKNPPIEEPGFYYCQRKRRMKRRQSHKGQLISKHLFDVFNSPIKQTKSIRLEAPK